MQRTSCELLGWMNTSWNQDCQEKYQWTQICRWHHPYGSQSYYFSSSHVRMWEHWVLKNWCFWTVVLEKTLESPLDCKEIQPVHPKGNQSWIFIGSSDAEAEVPILWPSHMKIQLIWKDLDAGKDWGQEEKRVTVDSGWDGWMTSPTQWTWVWANFGRQWRTRKSDVLQSMGSPGVRHSFTTEQQQAMQ